MSLSLMPEFIAHQNGAEKQDCERRAAKRRLDTHGGGLTHLRPVYLGDDLFACQPVAEAITAAGGDVLLTAKPSSHMTPQIVITTPSMCYLSPAAGSLRRI